MTIEGRIISGDSRFMLGKQATDQVVCPTDHQLYSELNFKGLVIDMDGFHRFIGIDDSTGRNGKEGGVVEVASTIMGTLVDFQGDMEWGRPVMTGPKNEMGVQAAIKRGGKVTLGITSMNEGKISTDTIIEFEHKP